MPTAMFVAIDIAFVTEIEYLSTCRFVKNPVYTLSPRIFCD